MVLVSQINTSTIVKSAQEKNKVEFWCFLLTSSYPQSRAGLLEMNTWDIAYNQFYYLPSNNFTAYDDIMHQPNFFFNLFDQCLQQIYYRSQTPSVKRLILQLLPGQLTEHFIHLKLLHFSQRESKSQCESHQEKKQIYQQEKSHNLFLFYRVFQPLSGYTIFTGCLTHLEVSEFI